MPFVFVGITGVGLGLAGFTNDVEDRVAYTFGETVSARNPRLTPLDVVCIVAAL